MQYIEKSAKEPEHWNDWFTTENRTYVYNNAGGAGRQYAKEFLLAEQSGLCAYCQSPLKKTDSSIEHVIPNSQNRNLSTLYHNLVVVCKDPQKDSNGRSHCDMERGNKLLPPLVFYENAQVTSVSDHAFIDASADGSISAKHNLNDSTNSQVQAFVDVLNLNHEKLMRKRNDGWRSITEIFAHVPIHQRKDFWISQLNSVVRDTGKPYRQYLAIQIRKKLN